MSRMGGSKGISNHTYIGSGIQYERGRIGGYVIKLIAAADLKLGDVTYISATDTVNKSATVGNHLFTAGIVVGGYRTAYQIMEDSALYNSLVVAGAGEDVIIQVNGICYCIAAAAIAVGSRVVPDTSTAGRVKIATTLAASGAVLSGAPGGAALSGTIAVPAGATPVTSTGAQPTLTNTLAVSAPTVGTLAVTAAAIAGNSVETVVGKLLEASSAGADIRRVLLSIR